MLRQAGLRTRPPPPTVADSPSAVDLKSIEGHIEYDDVTLTYPEGDSPALREIDFEASPNDFVGLVGPTGAGKSTLMKLLLRFYSPIAGRSGSADRTLKR